MWCISEAHSQFMFSGVSAQPPNKGMERTAKSVTPFAYAKAAPLSPAAHAWR